MRRVLILTLVLAALASVSFAQGYATVSGRVLDQQDAVLPGARVELTNTATGVAQSATSNAAGIYSFLRVTPGDYILAAELQNFKRLERPLLVQVSDKLEVDLRLDVGVMSETVSVTAESPLLRVRDAQQGEVITGEMIQKLPQLNRDPLALAILAGNVQGGDTREGGSNRAEEDSDLRINGGRAQGAEYIIDGIPAGTGLAADVQQSMPTMEGVGQFKVITNGLAAEYGRLSGGAIELVSNSGTNSFHGQGFYYLQDESLNANSWNQNRLGGEKPDFRNDRFGFALGGPLIKNRTFFYVNYEGVRFSQKGTLRTANVPTELERQGDLSQTVYNGVLPNMFDPRGAISPSGERLDLLGGDGRHVPGDRIDPVSVAILKYVPMPNREPSPGYSYRENYQGAEDIESSSNNFAVRLDHSFNDAHRIFARYTQLGNDYATSRWRGPAQTIPHNFTDNAWGLTVNYDWTVDESTLLNVRTGGYYSPYSAGNTVGDEYSNDDIPWDPVTRSLLGEKTAPWVQATQYTPFIDRSSINESAFTTFSAAASLTKIMGRHAVKMGYEHRRYYDNFSDTGTGEFIFQQNPVYRYAVDDSWNDQDGANVLGAYLLGINDKALARADTTRAMNFNYHAVYVQDDWKVNDRLTLAYGLRWDMETPVTERHDKLYGWDPDAPSAFTMKPGYDWDAALAGATLGDGTPSPLSPSQVRTPPWLNGFANGAIVIGGTTEHPDRKITGYDWDNFGPRFMATYRLGEKVVVRGSFAKVYGSITGERTAFSTGGPGVALSDSADAGWHANDGTGFRNLISTFQQPFQDADLRQYTRSTADANLQSTGGDPPAIAFNAEVKSPYEYTWGLGVQYALTKSLVVEASYNGNAGRDLIGQDVISHFPKELFVPGNESIYRDHNVEMPTLEPTGYGERNKLAFAEYPYPNYGPVVLLGSNDGRSDYHALNLRAQRRGQLFNFIVNYTLSRQEDNVGAPNLDQGCICTNGVGGQRAYQQVDNLRDAYGISPWDETHRLVAYYSVGLPFGKGRKWLSDTSSTGGKILDFFLGGWDFAGFSIYRSGRPLVVPHSNLNNDIRVETTFASFANPNDTDIGNSGFAGNDGVFVSPSDTPPTTGRRFDPSKINLPAVFTYGNLSVYEDIRHPHRVRHDWSLMKRFSVWSTRYLQLRLEAFNVFNQRGWAPYDTDPRSGNFGLIYSDGSNLYITERRVQVSARFVF